MTPDILFKLGLSLGVIGLGLGIALILGWDGVWRRYQAGRRLRRSGTWLR